MNTETVNPSVVAYLYIGFVGHNVPTLGTENEAQDKEVKRELREAWGFPGG